MQSSKNSAGRQNASKRSAGSAPKNGSSNYRNSPNGQPYGAVRGGLNPSAAAAAYAKNQRVNEPVIRGSGHSTRIHHRELIATVTGTVAFANFGSYNMNPGLSATFPWLSTQASAWEQYRFHKLKFELITRAPTTATGSVILSPDYDPLDAAPASEITAMTYRDASEDAPWKDQCVNLDPSAMFPMGPRKYVRSSAIAGSDLKTYDAGVMHVSTIGQANTDGVGKLFVEYDVELFVPQTQSSSSPTNLALSVFNLSANQSLTTATAATLAVDEAVTNGLGISNSSGVLTLPAGNYLVSADVSMSGGTAVTSSAQIELEKNGAAQAIPCLSRDGIIATGANTDYQLSLSSFVTSSGSDTIRLRVTYSSATGTLVARGDSCRLVVLSV